MDPSSISSRPDVTVATTAPRVTPTPERGAFRAILTESIVRGAETAMKVLPGSPLMAVAIRGGSGSGGALGIPVAGVGSPFRGGGGAPEGPGGASTRSGVLGSAASSAIGSATGTPIAGSGAGAGADANGGIESSLQQSQEMNLYYLQIQEQVNQQNRTFSTLSNVLKAEHDTVKTAIGNIR